MQDLPSRIGFSRKEPVGKIFLENARDTRLKRRMSTICRRSVARCSLRQLGWTFTDSPSFTCRHGGSTELVRPPSVRSKRHPRLGRQPTETVKTNIPTPIIQWAAGAQAILNILLH